MKDSHVVAVLPFEDGAEKAAAKRIAARDSLKASQVSVVAFDKNGFEWVSRGSSEGLGDEGRVPFEGENPEFELGMAVLDQIEAIESASASGVETEVRVYSHSDLAETLTFALEDDDPVVVRSFEGFDYAVPEPTRKSGRDGGWGPDRPTYTWRFPAHYTVFNSIIDNPVYGDERRFLRGKRSDESPKAYEAWLSLVPNATYTFYAHLHNNLSTKYSQASDDARLNLRIPWRAPADAEEGVQLVALISAKNAEPRTIWSSVRLYNDTETDIAIDFVPGSATLHTKHLEGVQLDDQVIGERGALIGGKRLDGVISGNVDEAGYVKFECRTREL